MIVLQFFVYFYLLVLLLEGGSVESFQVIIESDPSSAYKTDATAEVHMYILDIQIDQSLRRHRNNKEKDGDYAMQTRRPVVVVV